MKNQPRKRNKKHVPQQERDSAKATKDAPAPQPVNVVDGIPDRVEKPSKRMLILVLLIFAAWAAFLIYCLLAGRAGNGAM